MDSSEKPGFKGERRSDLIYDWNTVENFTSIDHPIEFDDETLRDGLQSPSVIDPPIEKKIEILHLMERIGIHSADVGLPGAGPRAVEAVTALVNFLENRDGRKQWAALTNPNSA